jgi:fidgetin-like protein 1
MDALKKWSDAFDISSGHVRREFPFQAAMVRLALSAGLLKGRESAEERVVAEHMRLVVTQPLPLTSAPPSSVSSQLSCELSGPEIAALTLESMPKKAASTSLAQSLLLADCLAPFKAHTIAQCQEVFRAEVDTVRSVCAAETATAVAAAVASISASSSSTYGGSSDGGRADDRTRRGSENAHLQRGAGSSSGGGGGGNRGGKNRGRDLEEERAQNSFKTAKRTFVEDEDGDVNAFKNHSSNSNGNNSTNTNAKKKGGSGSTGVDGKNDELPEELAHLDKDLVEKIQSDIVVKGHAVAFRDIAGLEFAKNCVQELICWPMTRPDIFTGLRALPKGVLLFGPPGTGKTLIGKAIAHEAGATFFSISASSLTSKWIGEGERLVRTLFAVAVYRQPSVVFIDEVDSLLCARKSDENEATRRLKTEFLIQLDGAGTNQTGRVVVLGATNRPEELDEAARRRFVKRIYIPLPDSAGRTQMFENLLRQCEGHSLTGPEVLELVEHTKGFSGADIANLCTEAAMGPVREIAAFHGGNLQLIEDRDMPPVGKKHFSAALQRTQPSVTETDLLRYLQWNSVFGTYKETMGGAAVAVLPEGANSATGH